MFMNSAWICHVAIFLYKAMWSTTHRYYSAGARHSVALKQFSPSRTYEDRDLLLTKTYVIQNILYKFNVAYRYKRIWTVHSSMICLSTGFTVALEHYCSCDGLLQWNLYWKGTCIERPPVYKTTLNNLFIPTKCIHVFLWLKKDPVPKTSLI